MIKVFYRACGETHEEQHAAAYELLYAAADFCGYGAASLKVEKTEQGKPFFAGRDDLFFSISHTARLAVCAISDSPCGVDTERMREIPKRVSDRYLGGKSGIEALYLWTERESFGKLDGRGFFAEPASKKVFFSRFVLDDAVITAASYEDKNADGLWEMVNNASIFVKKL